MYLTLLVLNLGAPDQDTHGCVLLEVGVLKVEIKLAGVLKGHEAQQKSETSFLGPFIWPFLDALGIAELSILVTIASSPPFPSSDQL